MHHAVLVALGLLDALEEAEHLSWLSSEAQATCAFRKNSPKFLIDDLQQFSKTKWLQQDATSNGG